MSKDVDKTKPSAKLGALAGILLTYLLLSPLIWWLWTLIAPQLGGLPQPDILRVFLLLVIGRLIYHAVTFKGLDT